MAGNTTQMRVEFSSPADAALLAAGATLDAPALQEAAKRPGSARAGRTRPPRAGGRWWLWPHLLSLDAPIVALAWQDWWHRFTVTPLPASQRAILGLGVWMIYLADRVADTTWGRPGDCATARHQFAEVWRVPLLVLTAFIGAGLIVLGPCTLGTGQFCGGLMLLGAAGLYFWLIHRPGTPRWMAWLPKEAVVGGMFSLGTAFFALCRPTRAPGELVFALVLFGAVCFLNCALITAWERNVCDRRDPYSFLNAFPRTAARGLRPLCWFLAIFAAGASLLLHLTLLWPVALAAASLGFLDRWRDRISPDALRLLADVVLLSPWLCWGVTILFPHAPTP